MGRETPVLLDLKPSGQHYMEDFHDARRHAARCCASCAIASHLDALTVGGETLGEDRRPRWPGYDRRRGVGRSPIRSIRRAASPC